MTLELILWFVAWVVLSEVAFVILYKHYSEGLTWIGVKFFSFINVGFFMAIQGLIVSFDKSGNFGQANYIHLVYELIIIAAIVGLFFCNWLISKKIDNWKLSTDKSRKKKGGRNREL